MVRLSRMKKVLEGLSDPDEKVRRRSWEELEKIAEYDISYLSRHRLYLRSLLWHRLKGIREDAWNHLALYKLLYVEGLKRALSAKSDKVKIEAWSHYSDLLNLEIVTKEELIKEREHFWKLLKSYYPTIRKRAWNVFPILVKEGIFQENDKERYISFMRSPKPSVRIRAWQKAVILLNQGFLTKEDILNNLNYINELLTKESNIKRLAQRILKVLNF